MPISTARIASFEEDVIDRLARIEERVTASAAHGDDHEKRLRAVEVRQWAVAPVAATFGALLGPFLAKLGLHLPS